MAIKTAAELKAYFETGDVPIESQYIDLIDTIFSTGWIKKTTQLTQSDVRLLNSANGSYGFLAEDSQGATKIVQFQNIIFKLNKTGGTYDGGQLQFINGAAADLIAQSSATVTDSLSATIIAPVLSGTVQYNLDSQSFLYASADSPSYEGTATLIYDYRIIDFS